MLDGLAPKPPLAIVLEKDEALQLVALLSYVGPLMDIWFHDSDKAVELAQRLGPKILEQIIAETDVTFNDLNDLTQSFKVGKSKLSLEGS